MSSSEELIELVKKLKRERSFISTEQKQIQEQFSQLLKLAEHVQHRQWITYQQRLILSALIYPNRSEQNFQPKSCFKYLQSLDKISFIDAHKYFNYLQDLPYLRFLTFLRQQPNLLALCLAQIEKVESVATAAIIPVLVSAIYNQCLYYEDELFLLEILRSLIENQLKLDSNPRILLQRSTCSFKILFDAFLTASHSCKLFLTAALHEPIMQVLIDDERFFDINPDASFNRPSKQERLTKSDHSAVNDRHLILNKLYTFTCAFVESLRNSMNFFPTSLSFLISQMLIILSKSSELSSREIRRLCCDLIMTLFIAPAICEPEKHGIIADIPISQIARHNLNQIAIILQTLALTSEVDSRTKDLYNKFKESESSISNCVSSILDNLIDSSTNVMFPTRTTKQISRNTILITHKQLKQLITFFRRASAELTESDYKQQLETHLKALLPLEECVKGLTAAASNQPVTLNNSESTTDRHHRQANGSKNVIEKKNERSENLQFPHEVIVFTLDSAEAECPGMLSEEKVLQENERTKLLKTNSANEFDPSATEKRLRFRLNDNCSVGNISDNLEGLEGISEGAASTGNLSVTSSCDDLDKAANEIETDPMFDNGSVSGRATPNLSGRDTPSSHISLDSSDRRTTSTNNAATHDSSISHQSTATNANSNSVNSSTQRGPVLPVAVQKPFREDVPDKFNLFDLPQQRSTLEAADETRSTISDNWSTMNAGVSEIDCQEQAAARLNDIVEELPIVEPRGRNELLLPESHSINLNQINKPIDQQSDCWSTEAFASDSETHSEDGSNLLRLVNQYQTSSSMIGIDGPDHSSVSSRSGQTTFNSTLKSTDLVEITLMKSSSENLPSISDSGILIESSKSVQSNVTPLKSPTETRSVHFPSADPLNDSTSTTSSNVQTNSLSEQSTSSNLVASGQSQSGGFSNLVVSTGSNPSKTLPMTKANEKRSTNAISALKRRFTSNSSNSQRRDRHIPEDDQEMPDHVSLRTETITADDILARYSSKSLTSVDSNPKGNSNVDETQNEATIDSIADSQPYYDPNNLESCRAFLDAKKKLRIVLSSADTDSMNFLDLPHHFNQFVDLQQTNHRATLPFNRRTSNALINFLRYQLYQAIAIQDRDLQAQLHETLRSIQQFTEDECKDLIRSMIDDYRSRSVYIAYLVKNHENLLNLSFHQDRLLVRIQRDQDLCKQQIINYLVKLYLDTKEESLNKLLDKFSYLSIAHEKMCLIERFLSDSYRDVTVDSLWRTASAEQISLTHISIERMVIGKIYQAALFPNGQIDTERDKVFSDHVRTLAEQLDPNHQKLRIQKLYQRECPWPSAQAELRLINAYKAPRDKIACVQRCIRIIQNLICLASNSAAGADETIPILIYVIIKANPPNLLSIMQYVQDLFSSRFTDEENYYWTIGEQFDSSIESIRDVKNHPFLLIWFSPLQSIVE